MCWLIHTHGPIEESHYAFRWLARTAKGDGLVQWNLQSEDLGHSGKVAEKHYLQVTDEHWGAAAVFRSPTGSPIAHHLEPSGPILETTKPRELQGFGGAGWLLKDYLVTPTGVEPVLPP